jgi:nanoRNase/pAp phosphatase (c-di-AMP/oligoRNAs hydrolase)
MDSAKSQIADKLKSSNNILITVSSNPSIDQLSACLGLTLLLNKLNKHAAAIYSGDTPSTIEFLKPEETIEKNTDSLRDFIISLDKSKADKLRYKVEDDVVKIFITPYKTSITETDFDFSQGDFNVDVVVALGVQNQEDIDGAITAHGRILHDAIVTSINATAEGGLGTINWHDQSASSLSELVTDLGQALGDDLFDEQVATALLTGIVAETERFSNQKTSSETMRASAALMAAGADQQLVSAKLSEPEVAPKPEQDNEEVSEEKPHNDGTIEIDHTMDPVEEGNDTPLELPQPEDTEEASDDETHEVEPEVSEQAEEIKPVETVSPGSSFVTEPPSMGGMLTANTVPEGLDPAVDPLSVRNTSAPILNRDNVPAPAREPFTAPEPQAPVVEETPVVSDVQPEAPAPTPAMTPPPADWTPPAPEASTPEDHSTQTLDELEFSVRSQEESTDNARDEVDKALNDVSPPPAPIAALNAQDLGGDLHPEASSAPNIAPMDQPLVDGDPTALLTSTFTGPPTNQGGLSLNSDPNAPASPDVVDPNAPPSVPPPIPFQFGTPNNTK